MRTSDTISELAKAVAAASLEFPPIERGRTAKVRMKNGGEYSYDYADLADVLSAVRGPLAKHGVSISHDCVVLRDPLRVETTARLEHASGEWKESSPLSLPCDGLMSETQQVGSACSYGRRYTTQAILGLSTDSDDDGNAAGGADATTAKREPLGPCPKCGKTSSVIAGKAEHGGGIVCWKKRNDGCGHTWATDAHPFTQKSGEGNVPSDQSNGAKKPEQPSEPERCKEFIALGKFLQNCRPNLNHEVTPDEATAIINWAVPDVGRIEGLRMMAGECKQIFNALRDSGMSGDLIYAEAVQAAAVV